MISSWFSSELTGLSFIVSTERHPHITDLWLLKCPRTQSSDPFYFQSTVTSSVNLAFNVTLSQQLTHWHLQPDLSPEFQPPKYACWTSLIIHWSQLAYIWPPESICEGSPALPLSGHVWRKVWMYKAWLLLLERPSCKVDAWMGSGNLNFKRVPSISQTDQSGPCA